MTATSNLALIVDGKQLNLIVVTGEHPFDGKCVVVTTDHSRALGVEEHRPGGRARVEKSDRFGRRHRAGAAVI